MPTFDAWKGLDDHCWSPNQGPLLSVLARCTAKGPIKKMKDGEGREEDPKTGFRRRGTTEIFYTTDIEFVMDHLQHTRGDKVRELREEAEAIFKQGRYATMADVYKE